MISGKTDDRLWWRELNAEALHLLTQEGADDARLFVVLRGLHQTEEDTFLPSLAGVAEVSTPLTMLVRHGAVVASAVGHVTGLFQLCASARFCGLHGLSDLAPFLQLSKG